MNDLDHNARFHPIHPTFLVDLPLLPSLICSLPLGALDQLLHGGESMTVRTCPLWVAFLMAISSTGLTRPTFCGKSVSGFGGMRVALWLTVHVDLADLRFFSWCRQENKHMEIREAIMIKHISKENYPLTIKEKIHWGA